MGEWRLFEEGTVPEWTTPEWYADRERAPHLEQGLHIGRLNLSARLVARERPASVVDLGAGDGGLLSLLRQLLPEADCWGYDLQPTNLDGATERGVDVRYGDVVSGAVDWAEAAVVTEMLEHLLDPHAFVRSIAENGVRVLVASSPWTEHGGSHYEFHTWAWDHAGYRALIEQAGYRVVAHETVDMFQVIMGVAR
jgi:SAM-dependent methyltransferase